MCLTMRLPVSRPLVSALASAFFSRERRNCADLTGQRALLTPDCLPITQHVSPVPYTPSLGHNIFKIAPPPSTVSKFPSPIRAIENPPINSQIEQKGYSP